MPSRSILIVTLVALLVFGLIAPSCQQENGVSTGAEPLAEGWEPIVPQTESYLPGIADVVALAKQSVVAVNTKKVINDSSNKPVTQRGAGSGWVIDGKGLIVTNNHVVDGVDEVTVSFSDGRSLKVDQVRVDDRTDLAILQVDMGDANITGLEIGNTSNLRVGDWVVAIGNPLNLGISAKEGIISRFGVSITVSEGQSLHDLVETSAAINPGNSGGPLLNMAGQVIGITSAKIAEIGVEAMGYAIAIDTALPIIERLVTSGCIERAWLGIDAQTVDPALASDFDLKVQEGALVTHIASDSPAEEAGIQEGDVIVSFNESQIRSLRDLAEDEEASEIGETVTIGLWRGESEMEVEATLAKSPPCKYGGEPPT